MTALSVGVACVAMVTWQHLHRAPVSSPPPEDSQSPPGVGSFDAAKLKGLDHLVMVAGHAVVLSETLDGIGSEDTLWYLEGYQRGKDLPGSLVGHIRSGVEVAGADPKALLVFSGGQTRPAAGPRDEGFSYYRVAEHYGWWGWAAHGPRKGPAAPRASAEPAAVPVPQRTVTEDFAADSFQNLLFSLCRFREVVGQYPSRITVVSFAFKRKRFEGLHRAALRFPRTHFDFVGLQPSSASRFNLTEAESGEVENAVRSFELDPYGCHTPGLVAKREARNPFRRTTPYQLSCTAMKGLLEWCGPGVYQGTLPWSPLGRAPP